MLEIASPGRIFVYVGKQIEHALFIPKFSQFDINIVMDNFDSFMFRKSLDSVAARCEREQLPIVEFVEWYVEEGQYQEGFLGSTGAGAGWGAGIGAGLGSVVPGLGTGLGAGVGAGIGAGLGGLYGIGKGIYNKFKDRSYNVTKQQAVDALMKFAQTSPSNAGLINRVANFIAKINPEGAQGRPSNSQQRNPQQAQAAPQAQPSLDDLFKQGLATREDLKKIAAMPPEQRAAVVQRLMALGQMRQSYMP